jgi:DNA-binding GntR family transcriptional regulator
LGAGVKNDIGLSKVDQIVRVLAREITQGPLLTCEAMLRLRRLTRRADGRVIEYVVSLLDPARFADHQAF